MPMDFLMQQMELREALADARAAKDAGALDELDAQVRGERKSRLAQVGKLLDGGDYQQAAQGVRSLMFLDKTSEEISRLFDLIEGN
jgi:molecular chaperone HscB